MKIDAIEFIGKDVRLSFEAETAAEEYQLKALHEKLISGNACCFDWENGEGANGITVIVSKILTEGDA